ncbi:hypothetical protein HBA92_20640 [Ochrobactrum sp. MR28]|nr:hypothetical protein [Ochrobactrum sp. MR28]
MLADPSTCRTVSMSGAFQCPINQCYRIAGGNFLQYRLISGLQLSRKRFNKFMEVYLADIFPQPQIKNFKSMLVASTKGNRKFYQCINEDRIVDPFFSQLRFYWRYRHFFYTPILRRLSRVLTRGAIAPY